MTMRAVLITGSRRLGLEGKTLMFQMLNDFNPHMIIHGDCPTGADLYAKHYCYIRSGQVFELRMPAQWHRHGKAAGPERNRYMARMARDMRECGHEVVCYAFPLGESHGTWDCMR